MAAYTIAQLLIHDRKRYERYVARFAETLVDFDAQHVPGMEDAEAGVRERLATAGFDRLTTSAEAVPKGLERRAEGTYRYTRADEIMCWLKANGEAEA